MSTYERLMRLGALGDEDTAAELRRVCHRRGMLNEDFVGLVSGKPSEELWAEICAQIERWEALGRPEWSKHAVALAVPILQGWPAYLRQAPSAWGLRVGVGRLPLGWPLVASVDADEFWGEFYRQKGPMKQAKRLLDLIRVGWLDHLERFDVEQLLWCPECYPDRSDVARMGHRLAQQRWLSGVERFVVRDIALSGEPLKHVMLGPWRALRRLTFLDCRLTDADAMLLAESSALAQVRTLNLANNSIGNAGARALAESPYTQNLTDLDLRGNVVGNAGAVALTQGLPHAALELRDNPVGRRGAQALDASPRCPDVSLSQLLGLPEYAQGEWGWPWWRWGSKKCDRAAPIRPAPPLSAPQGKRCALKTRVLKRRLTALLEDYEEPLRELESWALSYHMPGTWVRLKDDLGLLSAPDIAFMFQRGLARGTLTLPTLAMLTNSPDCRALVLNHEHGALAEAMRKLTRARYLSDVGDPKPRENIWLFQRVPQAQKLWWLMVLQRSLRRALAVLARNTLKNGLEN